MELIAYYRRLVAVLTRVNSTAGPPHGTYEITPTSTINKGVMRYEHGQLHCLDKPSIEIDYFDHIFEAWYKEGKLHRVDGPALHDRYCRVWCEDGELHCRTGPAWIRNSQGNQESAIYYIHNKMHRVDGPACVNDGHLYWLFCGVLMPEEKVRRIAATFRRALHRYRFRKFYRMMRWALSQEGAAALWSPESTCGRRAKQSLGSLVASMDLSGA